MNTMSSVNFRDISEEVIRAEIYSTERLEEYALYLAENLPFVEGNKPGKDLLRDVKKKITMFNISI